jgi:MOSC domain-containing protein YiiM
MMTSGVVLAIHLQSEPRRAPRPVEEARALVGHGLEGDYHGKGRPNTYRQVLIVDRRALEALGFAPGALREQLTVDFDGLDRLQRGTRLLIGDVEFEITAPCEPCETIGKYNAVSDPYALRDALQGRRGMLAKVVATVREGVIRHGDPVVVAAPPEVPAVAETTPVP